MKKLVKFPQTFDENTKQEIRDSILFYFDNVLHNHNTGTLKIIFMEDLSTIKKNKIISENKIKNCGLAILNADNYVVYINQTMCLDEIIKTIFHEFTHVTQHIQKRYRVVGSQVVWENRIPFPILQIDMDFDRYQKLPWEIEAHNVENEMFEKWKRYKPTVWNKVLDLLGLK